jgi:hypothetical protein
VFWFVFSSFSQEFCWNEGMFTVLMAKFPSFRPIKNCPGRFVSSARFTRLEEVCVDGMWRKLEEDCAKDTVWVNAFEDGTGGLIVFQKPDKTLVVTLSNTSGFARKMAMMRSSSNRFRRVGVIQEGVCVVVLTVADVLAHRGAGFPPRSVKACLFIIFCLCYFDCCFLNNKIDCPFSSPVYFGRMHDS